MSKKTVLILGASRYYARSIAAAREGGFHVVAVDRNPAAAGFAFADESFACDFADREKTLAVASRCKAAGVIPMNDIAVPTAAYVAAGLGLPGISEESALWSTNKEQMRRRWEERGVPCPRYRVAGDEETFFRALEEVGLPCILKPAHDYAGASRGVYVLRTRREAEEARRFSLDYAADGVLLVESFVAAEFEHSAEVLVREGQVHVLAVSDKVKVPLPYRVDKGILYPSRLEGKPLERLREIVGHAVGALGINVGAAHVELASRGDDFVLFELGARCGGGGIPDPIVRHVTGIDYFVETVRVLTGSAPGSLVPTRDLASCYYFLTPPPGVVEDLSGVERIRGLAGVLDSEVFLAKGSRIHPVTNGTQRSGFVITGAADRESAYRIGLEAENLLQITYAPPGPRAN